jgi:hypothetical protein
MKYPPHDLLKNLDGVLISFPEWPHSEIDTGLKGEIQ